MVAATLHKSVPENSIVFAVNGQKHALDSTQLPSATLFDYLRSDSTLTVDKSSFLCTCTHPFHATRVILFACLPEASTWQSVRKRMFLVVALCGCGYVYWTCMLKHTHHVQRFKSCFVGVRVPKVLVAREAAVPALWRCTAWILLQVFLRMPSMINVLRAADAVLCMHFRCNFAGCDVLWPPSNFKCFVSPTFWHHSELSRYLQPSVTLPTSKKKEMRLCMQGKSA